MTGVVATRADGGTSAGSILLAEDEADYRTLLERQLRDRGFDVVAAASGEEAVAALDRRSFDVVITDLRMPGAADGLTVLRHARDVAPQTFVLVITGYVTADSVVEALREGAADYIEKPLAFPDILDKLERLLEERSVAWEHQVLRRRLGTVREAMPFLIGESPAMKRIKKLIDQMARTDSTVTITGESGVGKEVVARAIHAVSHLRDQIFLPVNCAAIPDQLLESELFGHRKGSFTGADAAHDGLFRRARGGTLFLDEIGEMPMQLQAKLLRAIESKEIMPIGSGGPVPVQVRIIASTNVELRQAVRAGRFREDLFYRLNVIRIEVPPLRDRPEDIPRLVEFLVSRRNRGQRRAYKGVDNETMSRFLQYGWQGNVRELDHTLEYAMTVGDGEWIRSVDLPPGIFPERAGAPPRGDRLDDALARFERLHVESVLRQCSDDRRLAAERLGIDLSTLYRKIKAFGVDVPIGLAALLLGVSHAGSLLSALV